MRLTFILVILAGFLVTPAEGRENCRLMLQTYFKDGKRRLEIVEIRTDSREECRYEAMRRQISSEGGEDVARVNVIFAFRELAVLE